METTTYLVEIVLFFQLLPDLLVDGQPQQIRVLLADCEGGIQLVLAEPFLQQLDGAPGGVHLLVDRVLEVARKVLDFLDLELQVAPKPRQGQDHVLLNLSSLDGVAYRGLGVVSDYVDAVIEITGAEKSDGQS